MTAQPKRYALIGAGPTGLAAAQKMLAKGVIFVGFESSDGVGGLWDISNSRSTVYESAHLISSRTTTEFANFPMSKVRADYPSHRELKQYFDDFADAFDLREHFRFNTTVNAVTPEGNRWQVKYQDEHGEHTDTFDGVILASGTLAHPNRPKLKGTFDGELLHTADYKHPRVFDGKRVLLIGAGNSGCDIAVDAVHYAKSVDMSVRRGYYFVPKYMFGKPTDTLTQGKPLPVPSSRP
ncbi:flavin-containing monooxygenase [Leucobacter coleopterorum]|uniref:flavin-containing monooxygenase n=1 Tax=Leucobacter coleopterorum TaxID=2714933 RepID=UPI00244D9F38|nr:NAD(P)/FAD-dependent oxidoreductase [Leucobacter coleopterorum]